MPEPEIVPLFNSRLFPVDHDQPTTDDYFTPRYIFDALALTFDLDVAAPSGGVPWLPAARYYDQSADGLMQPWEGRVWMNPPYSNVAPWWQRFTAHRHGIALLPVAKSHWLTAAWRQADGIVIPEDPSGSRELWFVRPDRPGPQRIWFPAMFVAFGPECVDAIGRIGTVRRVA